MKRGLRSRVFGDLGRVGSEVVVLVFLVDGEEGRSEESVLAADREWGRLRDVSSCFDSSTCASSVGWVSETSLAASSLSF